MPGQAFGNPAPGADWRQVRAAVIATWLVCAFVGVATASASDETWTRIRSRNFIVTGDVPERELRRAIADLEAFHAALGRLYPAAAADAQVPTWVVIFNDRRFQRFLPRDTQGRPIPNVGGYFLSDPDASYIVFGRYDAAVDRRLILHEYAHSVLHRSLGPMPLWLSEGLADFYSTFDRDPKRGVGALGRPPADLLALLRSQELIGLNQILVPKDADRLWQNAERARMFYAESWALVHYLAIGAENASIARVGGFLSELARAVPAADAFKTAFGESVERVEAKLHQYVRRPYYKGVAVEADDEAAEPASVQRISDGEAHRLRGDLLLRLGTLDEAERELAAALAEDPSRIDARIAMARTWLATGRFGEGLEALQRIAREAPSNFAAQYYLGGALARRRRYAEAFAAFDSAALLNNKSASAWFAFSTTALALGLDDAAEAAIQRSMKLEFNPASYRARAYTAFGLGRHQAAAVDARRYIDVVGLREPAAQTVAFVAAIAHWGAGQPRDAEALLARVRAAAPRGSWNAEVVEFMQGRATAQQLISRAKTREQETVARTYIGLKAAIEGRTAEALLHLRWVRDEGSRGQIDYGIAVEELVRIELQLPELR